MVTNFGHSMLPGRRIRTATNEAPSDGLGGRVVDRLRQMYCGMHGHDVLLQFRQDRLFLRCASCGHETPGWSLDEAPPTGTMRGDARPLELARGRLTSERRIA